MALADRHYMRDPYHAPHVTTKLIIVLIAAFVIQSVLLFYWGIDLEKNFGLSLSGIAAGKIWQFLTFQFLHEPIIPLHVLFNCLGLYFFGRTVEEILGPRKFLFTYLLAGILGGVLEILVTLILPHHESGGVVGASAGICGMIAIFCTLEPMRELTSWIYFFPITIRARYFLMFLTGFSLFGTLVPFGGIAHAAHLGGILFGVAFVRWGAAWEGFLNLKRFSFRRKKKPVAASSKKILSPLSRTEDSRYVPEEEFISREVDPILDKISQHGIQSLTERERKILESARNKMAKR